MDSIYAVIIYFVGLAIAWWVTRYINAEEHTDTPYHIVHIVKDGDGNEVEVTKEDWWASILDDDTEDVL